MQEFKHYQLSNGLTVLVESNPAQVSVAVGFFVKTGSRDETPAVMGVSHFLEHMMFKGTATRSAEDVNIEFDAMGARYNAYTSQETTCYYANVLPEYAPRALALLADMLRPALRTEDFTTEKNVILEEIAMYMDRPAFTLYEAAVQYYFGANPMGHSVLGTRDTVGALTAAQMREYFDARYGPENIILVITGCLPQDEALALAQQYCGHWVSRPATRTYLPVVAKGQRRHMRNDKITRHHLSMLFPAPSRQDPQRHAAGLMVDILGDAEGARLYWALVHPGLVDEVEFSLNAQDQLGTFFVYASCAPENATQVETILRQEVGRMWAEGATALELERFRNKAKTSTVLSSELPMGRMRAIGTRWQYMGSYCTLAETLEQLQAVTCEQMRDVCRQYAWTEASVLTMGPQEA